MNSSEKKAYLRKKMRKMTSPSESDSKQIIVKILELIKNHPSFECIALYSPLSGEVDILQLLQATNKTWVFPKVTGDTMSFYHVENPVLDLVPGAYSISEPNTFCPKVPICEIDLFLCPGLAFTIEGIRLGRGKGYYDRALIEASNHAVFIGICFDSQITKKIPSDPHDVRMHHVITNSS